MLKKYGMRDCHPASTPVERRLPRLTNDRGRANGACMNLVGSWLVAVCCHGDDAPRHRLRRASLGEASAVISLALSTGFQIATQRVIQSLMKGTPRGGLHTIHHGGWAGDEDPSSAASHL